MNSEHQQLCASDEWAEYLREEIVPWTLGERDLGGTVLEVGPGPGLSTELLRRRVRRLTAVENDDVAAAALATRLAGTNVTVVRADATDMPFAGNRFTSAVAFTMLHHVPSVAAQDAVFAESARVLRPGGWFLAADSLDDPGFREFHHGDVCVPVDPDTLVPRLRAAGFTDVDIERGEGVFRVAARSRKE
ncbi:MAG: class I SAM-dependent methyltransferase [Actinomycetota bacterium]